MPVMSVGPAEMKLKKHLAGPAVDLITVPRLPKFDSLQTALGCLKLLPGVLKIRSIGVFELTVVPRGVVF